MLMEAAEVAGLSVRQLSAILQADRDYELDAEPYNMHTCDTAGRWDYAGESKTAPWTHVYRCVAGKGCGATMIQLCNRFLDRWDDCRCGIGGSERSAPRSRRWRRGRDVKREPAQAAARKE